MKLTHVLALPALLSLGFAPAPSLESIAFHPEAGLTRSKTFQMVGEFNLDDFSVVVDGEDVGEVIGDLEFTVTSDTVYELTDEYVSSENGRALKLRRRFDGLGQTMTFAFAAAMESGEEETEASSDLEGKSVLFTWNEDEESYDIEFDGESGDEGLLENLHEDMDLRALLPYGDVDEGATWEVPLGQLGSIFMPGGNLGLGMSELSDEEMDMFDSLMGLDMTSRFADILEGSCTCTLRSSGDVDGRSIAEIAVRIEANADTDVSDLLMDVLDMVTEEAGDLEVDIQVSMADLRFEFEAEGTFLWDYGAGVASSLELGGDAAIGFDLGISVDAMGQSQEAELSVEMSGTYAVDFNSTE
jgi:hypothetical protein